MVVQASINVVDLFWNTPYSPKYFLILTNIFFFWIRHAKSPSDAEGAVVKTWIDRQIAHGALVQSSEHFVQICQTMPLLKCNPHKEFKAKRAVIIVEHAEID